mmetsp:Transcript_7504/g.34201  ORF Transcript_7504/g.34201 Transcript_7504/m.34201 type:complete len:212 (-) Transcript_7504:94-729(-)
MPRARTAGTARSRPSVIFLVLNQAQISRCATAATSTATRRTRTASYAVSCLQGNWRGGSESHSETTQMWSATCSARGSSRHLVYSGIRAHPFKRCLSSPSTTLRLQRRWRLRECSPLIWYSAGIQVKHRGHTIAAPPTTTCQRRAWYTAFSGASLHPNSGRSSRVLRRWMHGSGEGSGNSARSSSAQSSTWHRKIGIERAAPSRSDDCDYL